MAIGFADFYHGTDGPKPWTIAKGTTLTHGYDTCTVKQCSVKLNDAEALDRNGKMEDIFNNMMKHDELLVMFFSESGHKSLAVPTEPFKKEYESLP